MRSIVGFLIHGFLSSLLDAKNHGLKNRQPFRLPWVFRWLLVPLSGSARRRSANPSVHDLINPFRLPWVFRWLLVTLSVLDRLGSRNSSVLNFLNPFRLPWVFRWLLVPLSGSARRRSANPSVHDLHKSFSAAVGFQMVVGSPFGIS